ncbi:MAG: hypothetical protein QM790_02935 [Nibricoccus sp.]
MITLSETALYLIVVGAAFWLALLWLRSGLGRKRQLGALDKTMAGLLALLLLMIPFGEIPLWKRLRWLLPNPSLPLVGMTCAALVARLFGAAFFKRGDWTAIWIFGAVVGSALYLHQLVAGVTDLYYWGWEREIAAWVLGVLAVAFLVRGNRLGALLLAALVAYGLSVFDSRNCWDYVMDPCFWITSVVALLGRLWSLRGRSSDDVPVRVRIRDRG